MLLVLALPAAAPAPAGARPQAGGTAPAGAVPPAKALGALETRRVEVAREIATIEKDYRGMVGRVERLKGARTGAASGPLAGALAEARGLADRLEALRAERRRVEERIVAAYDGALAAERDAARHADLSRRRETAAARLGGPAPALPIVKARAGEDPDDLRLKADLLRDAEHKLRREIARVDREIERAERQARLARAAAALDSPFPDDPKRVQFVRRNPGRPGRPTLAAGRDDREGSSQQGEEAQASNTPAEGAAGGAEGEAEGEAGATPAEPAADAEGERDLADDAAGAGGSGEPPPTTRDADGQPPAASLDPAQGPAASDAVRYSPVPLALPLLDPSTAGDLRRSWASPAARRRALDRAREELRRKAQATKDQAEAIEKQIR